jgi:DNA-directed RNA polymerase specialized sigma24 family protein
MTELDSFSPAPAGLQRPFVEYAYVVRGCAMAEIQNRVQEALNSMEAIDREVLALRHFEMLTNEEVAEVLGVKKTTASNRYVRAIKRLTSVLESYPELRP